MALPTKVVGRIVRINAILTITTPTDSSFSASSWCQLNPGDIINALSMPSQFSSATVDSVEVLNTQETGQITHYTVRVHLGLT